MPAILKSRLPQVAAQIPVRAGQAIKEGVEGMADEARANAPDRTPWGEGLPESIQARSGEFEYGNRARFAEVAGQHGFTTPTSKKTIAENGYGLWAAWYWEFLEFGVVGAGRGNKNNFPPRPFVWPAVERELPETIARVRASLRSL